MKRLTACLMAVVLFVGLFSGLSALADDYAFDSTPLSNSSDAKINNIELACAAVDGTYVSYGSTFSFNDIVGARTEKRGYRTAINGRGTKVCGGGVSQVATTIYLALKQLGDDIVYTEKRTYDSKFTDGYVDSGKDAVITDYEAGRDFQFENYYGDFIVRVYTDYENVYCYLESPDDSESYPSRSVAGYASISLDGSSALVNNIELAANSIYDTTLTYYDLFSFNDIVGPRTEAYGYENAINGRGAKVRGGGVAQVASVIWLAIKNMDDIDMVEKSTYGSKYNQSYVGSKNDAILTDYSSGRDFAFRYVGDGTMTIYTYIDDGELVCEISVE